MVRNAISSELWELANVLGGKFIHNDAWFIAHASANRDAANNSGVFGSGAGMGFTASASNKFNMSNVISNRLIITAKNTLTAYNSELMESVYSDEGAVYGRLLKIFGHGSIGSIDSGVVARQIQHMKASDRLSSEKYEAAALLLQAVNETCELSCALNNIAFHTRGDSPNTNGEPITENEKKAYSFVADLIMPVPKLALEFTSQLLADSITLTSR